jgi:hypothetical protein
MTLSIVLSPTALKLVVVIWAILYVVYVMRRAVANA